MFCAWAISKGSKYLLLFHFAHTYEFLVHITAVCSGYYMDDWQFQYKQFTFASSFPL